MLGLCDPVCALLKGPPGLLGGDPTRQHMLGCNSCAAKPGQHDCNSLRYVCDGSTVLQSKLARVWTRVTSSLGSSVLSSLNSTNFTELCTWSASDDVYTLLQCPAGLLGVGATDKQLAAQLWLREVLLEAVHEVMGLLG